MKAARFFCGLKESHYNNSMDKKLTELYFENLEKLKAGKISQEIWCEFCANILAQMMTDNADIFKRLKER